MSNLDLLIKLKRMYEALQDILENTQFEEHTYSNILNKQLYDIKNMYEEIWQTTYHENLTTGFHCKECGKELLITDVIDYEFICIECDENYSIDEAKVDENIEEHWYIENSYFINKHKM